MSCMANKYSTRLCIDVFFKTPHKVYMNFSVNPVNTPVLRDPSKNLIHSGGIGGGWILNGMAPWHFQ